MSCGNIDWEVITPISETDEPQIQEKPFPILNSVGVEFDWVDELNEKDRNLQNS